MRPRNLLSLGPKARSPRHFVIPNRREAAVRNLLFSKEEAKSKPTFHLGRFGLFVDLGRICTGSSMSPLTTTILPGHPFFTTLYHILPVTP